MSEHSQPVSFFLQPPGALIGLQLHGKTFGAAANVPPLHLLLPPLSPNQGRVVLDINLTDALYYFLKSCKGYFCLIASLFKCHDSPCLYVLYVYCVTGVVPGFNFEVGGT